MLLGMGCAYGQGYLFGRAEPAAHWQDDRQRAAERSTA
jgi:EAL domain-containing protein (putative c-di-GMP-specific phosphodiesterase class I)